MIDVEALADRLVSAVKTRTATTPFADELGLTVDAAYEIQDVFLAKLGGAPVVAKLGLTSPAKQQQMNVDEPLYGWLTPDMEIGSTQALDTSELIQPRVEPEIAFVTDDELGGRECGKADVLAATGAVMPAIDVLDSRFTGYRFTLADVTADNASGARYSIGEPSPIKGDLRLTGCVFERNGDLVATAAGAAVMDHPAAAVAWFVRKLDTRGRTLPAGSIVLAGGLTAALAVGPGDRVKAAFDRIGEIELEVV